MPLPPYIYLKSSTKMLALYEQQNGHFSFFGWPKPKKAQYRKKTEKETENERKREKEREGERGEREGRGERGVR